MIDELLELSDDYEEEEDTDKYMKIGLGVTLMGVGFVGSLIGNAIGTSIKKEKRTRKCQQSICDYRTASDRYRRSRIRNCGNLIELW